MQLTGIHHLTAVSADAPGNVAFYKGLLGMRLVKKTVNQDDVSAYHLFYADGLASPGSDLTFFDWPVQRERRGTHAIVRTALRVAGRETPRLVGEAPRRRRHPQRRARRTRRPRWSSTSRTRRASASPSSTTAAPAKRMPGRGSPVPAEHQIRGLGPITLSVPDLAPTDAVLTAVMNMRHVRDYSIADGRERIVHVYAMGDGGPAAELHVAVEPDLPPAEQGAGGVHHVAFRTPDDEEYDAWARRLREMRIPNSGKVDRFYFQSLYFREPNGILFEIATDGPGFATDEPLDKLGETPGPAALPGSPPRRNRSRPEAAVATYADRLSRMARAWAISSSLMVWPRPG